MAPAAIALTEYRVIRSCNQTFRHLFGYDASELIGRSFRLFYGSDEEFELIRDIGLTQRGVVVPAATDARKPFGKPGKEGCVHIVWDNGGADATGIQPSLPPKLLNSLYRPVVCNPI